MVPSNAVLMLWLVSAIETHRSLDTVHSRTAVATSRAVQDSASEALVVALKLALNLRSAKEFRVALLRSLTRTRYSSKNGAGTQRHRTLIRSTKQDEATPMTIGHAQTSGIALHTVQACVKHCSTPFPEETHHCEAS